MRSNARVTNWGKFKNAQLVRYNEKTGRETNIMTRPRLGQILDEQTRSQRCKPTQIGPYALLAANRRMEQGSWKVREAVPKPRTTSFSKRGHKNMMAKIGRLVAFLQCDNCCDHEDLDYNGRPKGGRGRVYILHHLDIPGFIGYNRWCFACGTKWRR